MFDEIAREVPRPALVLGFAGALPFVGLALASFAGGAPGAWAGAALLAYGAVILAFMGGIHWGWAMAAAAPTYERLGVAVSPALVGWGGQLLGGDLGLLVVAAGFAALLVLDLRAVRLGRAAAWYPLLRWPLTLIVVASLIVASLA